MTLTILQGVIFQRAHFLKVHLADASHIAAASVNALDMIVSLNFRHIVKEKTIKMTGAINTLLGYNKVEINSPMEVIDDEKTRYHLRRDSCNKTKD